jgi:MOSC domain-containing protein
MMVISLFEYPVKGLLGNKVCCATVNRRGLAMDRRWMLIDKEGAFLSQRQLPKLTQFLPEFQDQLTIKHLTSGETHAILKTEFTEERKVVVWGQECTSHGSNREIDEWLSSHLDTEVQLVYMQDDDIRPVESSENEDIVSFADAYPVLLATRASLDDLNSKLDDPIDINRFRPNIFIDGEAPFAEDNWRRIKIGPVIFKVVKRCARCHVININQKTGVAGREPLQTLSTYRKEGNKVNFAINLIPQNTGIIHEEDEVTILD